MGAMSFAPASEPFSNDSLPFATPNRIEFDMILSGGGTTFTIDAAWLATYFAGRPPAMLLRLFSQSYPTDSEAAVALQPLEYTAFNSIATSPHSLPPARRLGRNGATGKPEFILSAGTVDGQWRIRLRLPTSVVG
jgi:hypothetical protein